MNSSSKIVKVGALPKLKKVVTTSIRGNLRNAKRCLEFEDEFVRGNKQNKKKVQSAKCDDIEKIIFDESEEEEEEEMAEVINDSGEEDILHELNNLNTNITFPTVIPLRELQLRKRYPIHKFKLINTREYGKKFAVDINNGANTVYLPERYNSIFDSPEKIARLNQSGKQKALIYKGLKDIGHGRKCHSVQFVTYKQ